MLQIDLDNVQQVVLTDQCGFNAVWAGQIDFESNVLRPADFSAIFVDTGPTLLENLGRK